MKWLFGFIFLLIFCQLSFGKVPVEITGKITNRKEVLQVLYLQFPGGLVPLELKENATFRVRLVFQELPAPVSIVSISKKGIIQHKTPLLWIDSESISISLDLQSDLENYGINRTYVHQDLSEQLEQTKGAQRRQQLLQNHDKLPAIYLVHRWKKDLPLKFLETFMVELPESFQSLRWARGIASYIEAKRRRASRKWRKYVAFSLTDRQLRQLEVDSQNGQRKLVVFMSSGCGYSLASLPLLAQLQENLPSDLEIITIWNDSYQEDWLHYASYWKEQIVWTDLWDENGFAWTYFDNKSTPTFLLMDGKGRVKSKFRGYNPKTLKKLQSLQR